MGGEGSTEAKRHILYCSYVFAYALETNVAGFRTVLECVISSKCIVIRWLTRQTGTHHHMTIRQKAFTEHRVLDGKKSKITINTVKSAISGVGVCVRVVCCF